MADVRDDFLPQPETTRRCDSSRLSRNLIRCGVPLCWGIAALLGVVAVSEFRLLKRVSRVEIPLAQTELRIQAELVCGSIAQGLPPRWLHWDGQAPRAEIVDSATGEIVAPSLLDPNSLALNVRGVHWSSKSLHFVLDRQTVDNRGGALVLRCERVRPSLGFYFAAVFGGGIFLLGVVCFQIRNVLQADPGRRTETILLELRTTSFVLLSLLCGLAFYPGLPVGPMSNDSKALNALAAGLNSPESFVHDPLLCNPRNFNWYTPLFLRLTQLGGWLGFHYSTSRAYLSCLTILLGLFGYCRLFRLISGSEVFATLAALLLCSMDASYPPNEAWSPTMVVPRTVYGAILPWAICLAFYSLGRPRMWPVVGAALGSLFYVHPVSSPALTGAVLTGLLCGSRRFRLNRFAWSVIAAAVAIAVMVPYTLLYAARYSGTVGVDPTIMQQAFAAARVQIVPGYFEMRVFVAQVVSLVAGTPRYWVGLAVLLWLIRYRSQARSVRIFGGMTAGFGIVMLLIPWVDQLIAERLGRFPFQFDLIRNIRYLDVFFLALCGIFLRETRHSWIQSAWSFELRWSGAAGLIPYAAKNETYYQPHTRDRKGLSLDRVEYKSWTVRVPRQLAAVSALLLLAYGYPSYQGSNKILDMCLTNVETLIGEPRPQIMSDLEVLNAVQAFRRPQEVVSGPLHLRQAHIPLTLFRLDLGTLLYVDPAGLVKAQATLDESAPYVKWPITPEGARAVATLKGADLLVVDRELASPELMYSQDVLFQNAASLVCRFEPESHDYPTPELTHHQHPEGVQHNERP